MPLPPFVSGNVVIEATITTPDGRTYRVHHEVYREHSETLWPGDTPPHDTPEFCEWHMRLGNAENLARAIGSEIAMKLIQAHRPGVEDYRRHIPIVTATGRVVP